MSLELVLITGMSGSGKSVALHALEDAGYYCVDNLPPELLLPFIDLEQQQGVKHVAIAMDIRSAASLHLVPGLLAEIAKRNLPIKSLFLDASTDTLVRRYSETRRKHPLSSANEPLTHTTGTALPMSHQVLVEAINSERELLADLREGAHVIDTSNIRPAQLLAYVKSLIKAPNSNLTLVFESFAFKRGIPINADFVFDVRMLPNPYYEPALRTLTGRDEAVQKFLSNEAEVVRMQEEIMGFLHKWLPSLKRDHRSYVTIAIGCTGGQHRSVYMVEQLANSFAIENQYVTLKRHRELINH